MGNGDSANSDESANDSSDDTDDDDTYDVDTDTDSETVVDPCNGLEGSACTENYDEYGDPQCAQNVDNDDCYSIVQSQGLYGSGNFDDGFVAAQREAAEESESLNAIVSALSGTIGALVLIIAAGAYYVYRQQRTDACEREVELGDLDDWNEQTAYIFFFAFFSPVCFVISNALFLFSAVK